MEVLDGQTTKQEELRFFDIAASVDLIRFDLINRGAVQPETYQRVYDEEFSFVAEGIDRPLTTIFVLKEINGEFVYFSNGEWRPYLSMLTNGVASAQQEANMDPRKSFLVDMAVTDYLVAKQWHKLKPGESMIWHTPFPDKELTIYGENFMNSLGFQSKRRMGFIYEAERNLEGNLVLTSRSVDNSDDDAFVAAMIDAEAGADPVKAYDDSLALKHGRKFNAGRMFGHEQNAWAIIQNHKDLIELYMTKLVALAHDFDLDRHSLVQSKKRLTYSFWAAIKERIDHGVLGVSQRFSGTNYRYLDLEQELHEAYEKLQAKGEVLFGCGGSLGSEIDLLEVNPKSVFDSIFGGGKDKYGSLTFKCQRGHRNVRPRGMLIPRCTTCKISVKC